MTLNTVPEEETVHGKIDKNEENIGELEILDEFDDETNTDQIIEEIKKSPVPVFATDIFETINDIKKKIDSGELKGVELVLALWKTGIRIDDDDGKFSVINYIVKHMERSGKGNTPLDIAKKLSDVFKLNVTAHDISTYYNPTRSELTDIVDIERADVNSDLMVKEEFYKTAIHTNQIVAKDLFDLGEYAERAKADGNIGEAIRAKKVRLEYIHKYQTGIGKLKPSVGNITINKVDFNKIVNEVEKLDDIQLSKVVKKYEKRAGIKHEQTIEAAWQNVDNNVNTKNDNTQNDNTQNDNTQNDNVQNYNEVK